MIYHRATRKFSASSTFILTACACTVFLFIHAAAAGSPAAVEPQPTSVGIPHLEQRLIQEGFIDVRTLDPHIMVELEYARAANFIGENVYGTITRAYLRPEAAEKLARASEILRERHPGLRILVTDAVRPRSIQHKMWKLVAGTPRQPYIANPSSGSMHNYGAAVDVTLYNIETGRRLDMGTPIYFLGSLAQPALERDYLRAGKLNAHQIENRAILRKAMVDAGWHSLSIEWWHFDAFPRDYVRREYSIFE